MIHTTSSIREFRTCQQRYHHKYISLIRTVLEGRARLVGTASHSGFDAFWLKQPFVPDFSNDFWVTDQGQIEQCRVRAMVAAYGERWAADSVEWGAVEAERVFNMQLGGFSVSGKLDKLAWCNGRLFLVEHKTTYWQRIALDLQMALYQESVEKEFGERPGILYDVVRKPEGNPKLKEKIAKRKSETDADYEARKAAARETLEEFEERLKATMLAEPDTYLVRRMVHKTREQQAGLLEEAIATMAEIERTQKYARNDAACVSPYGACAYLGVCTGIEQLDSPKFTALGDAHPELDGKAKEEDAINGSPAKPSAECPI
jgi:hypothetical protein